LATYGKLGGPKDLIKNFFLNFREFPNAWKVAATFGKLGNPKDFCKKFPPNFP
jgi:hypothetical protein